MAETNEAPLRAHRTRNVDDKSVCNRDGATRCR